MTKVTLWHGISLLFPDLGKRRKSGLPPYLYTTPIHITMIKLNSQFKLPSGDSHEMLPPPGSIGFNNVPLHPELLNASLHALYGRENDSLARLQASINDDEAERGE